MTSRKKFFTFRFDPLLLEFVHQGAFIKDVSRRDPELDHGLGGLISGFVHIHLLFFSVSLGFNVLSVCMRWANLYGFVMHWKGFMKGCDTSADEV
jgi:hypothetical protein